MEDWRETVGECEELSVRDVRDPNLLAVVVRCECTGVGLWRALIDYNSDGAALTMERLPVPVPKPQVARAIPRGAVVIDPAVLNQP
jgi:hypothetical protein